MKILIIEDDDDKRKKLEEFIKAEFQNVQLIIARSLTSGLRELANNKDSVNIVLLDMSMPTYDISQDEPSGGTPEGFAGKEILSQMKLRSINIPTIVVTMFDSFGDDRNRVSLSQLVDELASSFEPNFVGFVYYSTNQESWKVQLKNLIKQNTQGI